MYGLALVMLGVVALEAIPLGLSRLKESHFTSTLRFGETRANVMNTLQTQHLKLATFFGQSRSLVIVDISQRWRVGTACDEVLYERLEFDADALARWSPWISSTCI